MLLRNDRTLVLLLIFFCLTLASRGQAAPGQTPASQTPAQSSSPAASSPVPAQNAPPTAASGSATPQSTAPQQEPESGTQAPPPNQQQSPDQNQPPANDNSTFVFKTEVQNVILHATVVDDKNRLMMNLDKNAFTVFENNQPQTVVAFAREDVPVAMGIIIDNSGSMREKRDKVNKAALNLVRSSNPQDQVFVVNFK